MVAQEVVIWIVLHPVKLAPAASEGAFDEVQRLVYQTCPGPETSGVQDRAHIIGIQLQRTARPFSCAFALARIVECVGAECERASIAGIQCESAFGPRDA